MFTVKQLIEKVRELAKERPDVTYEGVALMYGTICCYHKGLCSDGSEGCIFGQAMKALGHLEEDTGSISFILGKLNLAITNDQKKWCQRVQAIQDREECWSNAVTNADRMWPNE